MILTYLVRVVIIQQIYAITPGGKDLNIRHYFYRIQRFVERRAAKAHKSAGMIYYAFIVNLSKYILQNYPAPNQYSVLNDFNNITLSTFLNLLQTCA